jgi:hypothetical protein
MVKNNTMAKDEISKEIKMFWTKWKLKYILSNVKILKWKFIALNENIRNKEKSKINNLSFYLRRLDQMKSKIKHK